MQMPAAMTGGVFWAAPALAAPPSFPSRVICAAANDKPSWGKRGHSRALDFPNHEEGAAVTLHSPFTQLLLTAV